eukprot:SAG22_NODE_258_length_13522_cov_6.989496_2_plen_32_part_00
MTMAGAPTIGAGYMYVTHVMHGRYRYVKMSC